MDAIELLTTTRAVRRRIDFTQAVMLAVGFYEGDTFEPASRLPVASYVHHNGW